MKISKEEVREAIRNNYAEVALKGTGGSCCCSGSSCCGGSAVNMKDTTMQIGYTEEDIADVPIEANMGLGCGNPIAIALLKIGDTVLDLGCGGGFDCFLARKRVGDTGYVIGVDMTSEMIKLARANAKKSGYTNVDFRLGEIEHLPVEDASVDVIISNCVINLSPDKDQVFKEAYRVLKPGGRLLISDIVATKQLPDTIRKDLELVSSCIGGAEFIENIKSMMHKAGLQNILLTQKNNSKEIINSWFPDRKIEDYVASFYIEATK